MTVNTGKVVHSGFIRFPGLLYELGLSGQRNQVLSIKLEVETTVVRRYVLLQLQHHDRASLLAGKLHALLQRDYVKGRDVYDLFWYLSSRSWPEPNLELLNNALDQTRWQGGVITKGNWKAVIQEKIEAMQWNRVIEDVTPFLEKEAELRLLTRENISRLLQ